jgi:hypothetical protein
MLAQPFSASRALAFRAGLNNFAPDGAGFVVGLDEAIFEH